MSSEKSASTGLPATGPGASQVPAVYTSIPLPPREVNKRRSRPRFLMSVFARFQQWWKLRPCLSPAEKRKRLELAQALGVAIIANLVLVLLLLTIAVDPKVSKEEAFFIATSALESDAMDESAASAGSNAPAADDSKKSSAERGAIELKPTVPRVVTAPSMTPISQEFESIAMQDPTALMGQSISMSDFAEVESQRRKSIRNFVESSGNSKPIRARTGLGSSGIGKEMLGSIFQGDALGDGSNAVVMLDISGSMEEISDEVEFYMRSRFKETLVRQVQGCSMKQVRHPFASTLLYDSQLRDRTDFYFVCDLRDGETKRVIDSIRKFLTSGPHPRRLHVVSFDRAPSRYLSGLLASPGNTLIMARSFE